MGAWGFQSGGRKWVKTAFRSRSFIRQHLLMQLVTICFIKHIHDRLTSRSA